MIDIDRDELFAAMEALDHITIHNGIDAVVLSPRQAALLKAQIQSMAAKGLENYVWRQSIAQSVDALYAAAKEKGLL